MLFISHNRAVVRFVADTVAVMSHGRIVESGPRDQVFTTPAHPYARKLLATSRFELDTGPRPGVDAPLRVLSTAAGDAASGCRIHNRSAACCGGRTGSSARSGPRRWMTRHGVAGPSRDGLLVALARPPGWHLAAEALPLEQAGRPWTVSLLWNRRLISVLIRARAPVRPAVCDRALGRLSFQHGEGSSLSAGRQSGRLGRRPGGPWAFQDRRRQRWTDRTLTRRSLAIEVLSPLTAKRSVARSRSRSRAARRCVVRPPPCGNLTTRAYRRLHDPSASHDITH
ncbi:peptide ABC transporter ATPase [Streptomyces hygroscopicus]|nr:peptide ABC transporter ATPase [Streptomyces hygroscopicus]